MEELIEKLIEIALKEMPQVDKHEILPDGKSFRLSWKIKNDELRKSKRTNPIIVRLHEDFFTSDQTFDRIGDKLYIKFATFIRDKSRKFAPRVTDNANEIHTPDYWVFPPEC